MTGALKFGSRIHSSRHGDQGLHLDAVRTRGAADGGVAGGPRLPPRFRTGSRRSQHDVGRPLKQYVDLLRERFRSLRDRLVWHFPCAHATKCRPWC
uniref:Uncharacterized protein n=1 Tax=Rhodococcus hoagii TaxID=43767 RepID=A0A1Z1UYU5_RHOHA|nr:hypothetical protein pVAPB1533_0660 [Prescottella equi]